MRWAPVLWALLATGTLAARPIPPLSSRVVDEAGMLSAHARTQLIAQLKDHERATSNQVAVLIIASLQGEDLEQFSIRVVEQWKLGDRRKDNGALLLIVRDDRKMRIEVGQGLEGALTDARCSRILRDELKPRFRQGDFDGGVRAGVDAILGSISGEYQADDELDSLDWVGLIRVLIFCWIPAIFLHVFWRPALYARGVVAWLWFLTLTALRLVLLAYPLYWLHWPPLDAMAIWLAALAFPLLILYKLVQSAKGGRSRRGSSSTGDNSDTGDSLWSSSSSSDSYNSSSSSSSSDSSDSFSGGGGDFSGGGASDSW
ncbi:MAG: TPM domain-containing protein [Leptospirales bacterium]|nr:TPM domain-containing protein [Leptospirales bacterium]